MANSLQREHFDNYQTKKTSSKSSDPRIEQCHAVDERNKEEKKVRKQENQTQTTSIEECGTDLEEVLILE